MKPKLLVQWLSGLCALCLLISFSVQAKDKAIKLRNETITTHSSPKPPNALEPGKSGVAQPKGQTNASGLFLIQFADTPTLEWLDAVRKLGINLVRYVPDDAFIVRLRDTPLDTVQALPFVQYVGEYRADHKIHPSLRAPAKGKPGAEQLYVSVLFAPLGNPAEKAQARRGFTTVQQESHLRHGSIYRGKIPKGQLQKLAESPDVLWIEPGPRMKLFDEVASDIVAGEGGIHSTYTQLNGFDGTGVTVAVADSGLDTGEADFMHPDLYGRTPAFLYYGNLEDASDEHSHGTHVSGIIAGNATAGEADENNMLYGLGVAPNARIITQRIFDGVGNYEAPPSFGTLTRDAVRTGADIGSNSWGDDTYGDYDTSAMEFDALVRDADEGTFGDQQYILEFSAGNAGPDEQTIGSPAVGKNVIATGASQNNRPDLLLYSDGIETMADFSSRGPCSDGRIKPDLVAPGTWISSAFSSLAPEDNTWGAISGYYAWMSGTSQAGPHASGAAAVFVQYYRQLQGGSNPSPALVKAALINSAVDMDDTIETDPAPNMDEGWGRIDLTRIIGSTRSYQFIDQTERLSSGQIYESHVLVPAGDMPLKFTLVYTDVPGTPLTTVALVNDLDLEVIGPDGRAYHGNQFVDGESIPNATGYDSLNNVEGIHIPEPLPGEYIVRIRARRVVEDALQETPGVIDQDFALAISGNLLSSSGSLLALDRRSYTAPSRINIKLFHPPLAGTPSITALVRSTTEISGESIVLRAVGTSGVFTGSVATVTGFAAPDSRLQVRHDDLIEVICNAPQRTFTAAATCDLNPPLFANVMSENRFSHTYITWDTDEPAEAILRYGTNPANLNLAVTSTFLSDWHTLPLYDLVPGATYYYLIIATDEAGNKVTNNNGGSLFSFVAPIPATVLLVDSYFNDLFTIPPLSGYTTPLTQAGVTYEVWDVETEGLPTLNDLRPFPVVIWRVAEFSLGSTFGGNERLALTKYLEGGGSLLMASMELTSRLEGSGTTFRNNVLHVASYNEDTGVASIVGTPSDPVSSGINLSLDYIEYEDEIKDWVGIPADASDTIIPGPGAAPILYNDQNQVVGLRYPQPGVDVPGRVIFLSFPLDAIPLSGTAPNNRSQLLANMVSFLVPGYNGLGTVSLDSSSYGLPSLIHIEVADSDLQGLGEISVTISSTTVPAGPAVRLYETTRRRGVFQGSIQLVSATNAPASNQLRARSGDTIWVDYYDDSTGRNNRSSAVVDTTPCGISNVDSLPDYVDAWVTWDSSEPADSLVQFGKTKFLDRVASVPDFVTAHEVMLTGLEPDQTYYYQVVSRDQAGNITVDDNNGQFYTFTTLHPVYPPWSDDFSSQGTDWTVFTSEDSDGWGWQWGTPANGLASEGHSPPAAWGSNLNGEDATWVETFLISPPLYITGGNKATLSFWHNQDFMGNGLMDVLEGGAVMVITNQAAEPFALKEFNADTYTEGWEEVNVDLSPYSGQVIYLVWYYLYISFDFENVGNSPGWLVDDVSVTVSTQIPGTIVITNNLWQAQFNLNGPRAILGRGTSQTITNAPPGQYVLTWNDIPFYQTPPPQTNTLASSASIRFQGNYTFTDANHNGISDEWEMNYFNSVSPSRTQSTDSDGDGATDYAEFLAGTDPRVATSKLVLSQPIRLNNGTVRLAWVSAKNRAYRVEGSTNGITWAPVSDWLQTSSSTTYFNLPPPTPGGPYLFRVMLKP